MFMLSINIFHIMHKENEMRITVCAISDYLELINYEN